MYHENQRYVPFESMIPRQDRFAVLILCSMMVQIKFLQKFITDGFGESLN